MQLPIKLLLLSVLAAPPPSGQTVKLSAGAPHPYASAEPLAEARIFAEGVVSTADHEDSPGFDRDGRTVYWAYGLPILSTIVFSRFERGRWGEPEVAPFSGRYHDRDPFVSPDGRRLYFCSRRPAPGADRPRNDWDIWYVERTASGAWGEPQRPGPPVNTDSDELYATETADGTLYFGSARTGDWELYRSPRVAGGHGEPENLGEAVNSKAWDFNPMISPDERFLLFSSQRPGGPGSINIYVSFRRGGAWTPARHVGERVNAGAWQYHPMLSPDGRYLFFCGGARGLGSAPLARPVTYRELLASFRGARNNAGNIYQIELRALGIE